MYVNSLTHKSICLRKSATIFDAELHGICMAAEYTKNPSMWSLSYRFRPYVGHLSTMQQ